MGTPTLTQARTIFKVAPTAPQTTVVLVDNVPCAIPERERRGIIARFVHLSDAVEQARDEFVESANRLASAVRFLPHESARDEYEEKFETLQHAIVRLSRAQQEVIQQYRVAVMRGGVAFYARSES